MEILGYFLAIIIGFSLGLLGGGGSILTVPILVYVIKLEAKLAIALSLAIVGFTSLVGVIGHYRNQNISFKVALIFAPFAMLGTYLGASWLAQFLSGAAQLLIFAFIMLLAAGFMLKGRVDTQSVVKEIHYPTVILVGVFVGIITGLVGIGGGFLIVPALVLLTGLSMKKSVGTSLFIISLNSFSGFYGYLNTIKVPWPLLLKFIAFSTFGILIGSALVPYVSQSKLKKIFAYFLIIMGLFILFKNRVVLGFA